MSSLPKPTLPLNSDFGPYHLVKLIAVGGMAEIYLVRTRGVAGFEKMLALKVIHPDFAGEQRFVQMLVDEAKLAVKLNHANITQTFDLGKIGGTYFISMEFVDGGDFLNILKGLSERDAVLPIEAAVFVAREACAGLDYAHNKADAHGNPLRIIHRDVSPQNILLSRHGEVKLVDFGIAKAANVSSKTRAGVIKGKLVYMSPEQSWGEAIDQRSDIFSAGIVLYEALTGGSLYLEQNPVKLLERVRRAEIRPPSALRPEVDADLDRIVMKALARSPADRYGSARAFGHALSEYLRKRSPDYGSPQIGALVESIVDNKPLPDAPRDPPRRGRLMTSGRVGAMDRADYAVHGHSVIFSAEEMMESKPPSGFQIATAAPAGQAKLILLDQAGPKPFELGEQFIIGRSGDLRLADGRVSRRHARIVLHDGSHLLEDLKSSNGTFLNDQKVEQIRRLHPGDMIRIGPFEMRFVIDEVPRPKPPSVLDGRVAAPAPDVHNIAPMPGQSVGDAASARRPRSPKMPPLPAADMTASQPQAMIKVIMGDEELVMPVERNLPLDYTVILGNEAVGGVASTLVRRPDGYWLEPAPDRDPVYLNGEALSQPRQLSAGDTLSVGPLEFRFEVY